MRAGNINNFSEIANIIYILSTCEWSHYFKNKFYYVRWKISIRKKSETGIQFLNGFFAGVSIFLLTFSIQSEVLLASNAKHSWKLKSYMTLRGNYGFLILLFFNEALTKLPGLQHFFESPESTMPTTKVHTNGFYFSPHFLIISPEIWNFEIKFADLFLIFIKTQQYLIFLTIQSQQYKFFHTFPKYFFIEHFF